jgi:predicted RNA-binding protein associated with RNAse of E/G family
MAFCRERKRLLSGGEVTYNCELITLQDGFGILRYKINSRYQVGSVTLLPGMISYGFYWTKRPYTLYVWLTRDGDKVGYYFNLADDIKLCAHEFGWRDLCLDILVLPSGKVETLDEDQLPANLEQNLRHYIESARQLVLRNCRAIIEEAEGVLQETILKGKRNGIH